MALQRKSPRLELPEYNRSGCSGYGEMAESLSLSLTGSIRIHRQAKDDNIHI